MTLDLKPGVDASSLIPADLALSAYHYELPPELIAQTPAEPRDSARLLVLDRSSAHHSHRQVSDLVELLRPGDLVVVNRSRVLPCRMIGRKSVSGGKVELLFLHPLENGWWAALVGGRRVQIGQRVELGEGIVAELGEATAGGRAVRFIDGSDVPDILRRHGTMPLPPYIRSYRGDPERYQTVYSEAEGSSAAPTAGLHFTPELIDKLTAQGVGWTSVVLHVGIDTFKPIAEEDVRQHHIHTEWIEVSDQVVGVIQETKARGGRVVAIGTTTVRALEHAARGGSIASYEGAADLFITPGYRFRVVDAMLTNFHLPHSSLLLLVSAFAGRERILQAYAEAVQLRYRFFSFGDAMLLV